MMGIKKAAFSKSPPVHSQNHLHRNAVLAASASASCIGSGSRFVRVSVPATAGASCKGWCFWFVMIAQDSSPQIIVFFATVERILFRPPRAASHAADRSLRRLPLSPRRLCIALAKVLMTKRILYLNVAILYLRNNNVKRF